MSELSEKKKMSLVDVIVRLKSLDLFDHSIAGGCECCGTWIEHEESKHGEWIRLADIEVLIEDLEKSLE